MDHPRQAYWRIKLNTLKQVLEGNGFEAHRVESAEHARNLVLDTLLPRISPSSISWGGSQTFTASGLYSALKNLNGVTVLDTYDKSITPQQLHERRRQALLTDLYFTGTNAVTEDGRLVNLDMIGNRVGALTFGPKHVIVLAGRNKVVPDLESAFARIKQYAAPANVMRLDKKTPCLETAVCQECRSPDRICNTWTITEKSFPQHRIAVILIADDLGL